MIFSVCDPYHYRVGTDVEPVPPTAQMQETMGENEAENKYLWFQGNTVVLKTKHQGIV